jgi:hypothetical protein
MLYFVIIVFICLLYIHIKYYIDYADTDQIYALDVVTHLTLDKSTYLKHPVTFNYNINNINNFIKLDKINILDISNNYNEILLKEKDAMKLIKLSNYYSQYNDLSNSIDDKLFKPLTTISNKYDILFGQKDVVTKLSSEYAYRTILVVVDGSIDIKLVHPKYSNLLNEELNCKYIVRESNYNIWNNDIPKSDLLHLEKGKALSIPIYWWWSIKFGSEAKILQFKYYTFMNQIVILPILAQIWLNN